MLRDSYLVSPFSCLFIFVIGLKIFKHFIDRRQQQSWKFPGLYLSKINRERSMANGKDWWAGTRQSIPSVWKASSTSLAGQHGGSSCQCLYKWTPSISARFGRRVYLSNFRNSLKRVLWRSLQHWLCSLSSVITAMAPQKSSFGYHSQ